MEPLNVSVDLSELLQMDAFARIGLFANLSQSVADLAQTGAERWREAIDTVPGIWQGERQAYKAAIRLKQLGPYAWEISNNYQYVQDIESGRPPRDLKRMLNTSPKVRVTKKGQRYLIIPMRHNTPNNTAHAPAMPAHVYAAARQLAPSKISGHSTRKSGLDASDINTQKPMRVRKRKYVWGERLPAGMTPKLQTRHKSDPTAGMVRMKESTGGSSYLTFRVMMEGSDGWIIPAKPGLWIAKTVAESLRESAAQDLPEALRRDLDEVA